MIANKRMKVTVEYEVRIKSGNEDVEITETDIKERLVSITEESFLSNPEFTDSVYQDSDGFFEIEMVNIRGIK